MASPDRREQLIEVLARAISQDREALRPFQHYGFIVMTDPGGLGVEGKGKAPHFRLTEAEWPGIPLDDFSCRIPMT